MPAGAKWVAGIGVVLSVLIGLANLADWQKATELEWAVVQDVPTPKEAAIPGGGSFRPARMTVASIPAAERGDLLFRVSGVLSIDRRRGPVTVRCDVGPPPDASAELARTPSRRAAWPRPTEVLAAEEVPEQIVVDFSSQGAEIIGLPVRDSFRRFSDSQRLVRVDWKQFEERTQRWIWLLPDGTGSGAASLGWAVVFKTVERPRVRVLCRATAPQGTSASAVAIRQDTWPVPDAEG